MKKLFSITLLLSQMALAQNDLGSADDAAKIALNVLVSDKLAANIPYTVKSLLENKMNQLATQNGYGGSGSGRFIITPNVIILSKDVTSTAPPMTALQVEVTLFIADIETKTKFASLSVQLKGVDRLEDKALVEAVKTLNIQTPAMKKFVLDAKNKILEYYNTKCDFILKDAQSLVEQKKYELAIARLNEVPDVCKVCYDKAKNAIAPVYKKYMEINCITKLTEARLAFAAQPNSMGAEQAKKALVLIDPEASCYPKVLALADSMAKKVEKNEQKSYDFALKVLQAETEVAKYRAGILETISKNITLSIRSDPYDWLF